MPEQQGDGGVNLRGDRMPEITVGLFGPRRVVRQMQDVAQQVTQRYAPQRLKFLSGAHDSDNEAEERFRRLADRIDAAVFPGPWMFDLARGGHWLRKPATHVALTGAALYAALLRAMRTIPELDLARVSIDSLSRADVEEAYAEVELDPSAVRCQAYESPESVARFVRFHRTLWERGRTSAAFTTILSVEQELRSAGVPVERISPTKATVRDAVETAVLLGQGMRLGAHQIAMVAVQLIPAGATTAESSDYWQQELALATQQELLAEARTVGATVVRRSDTLFLVTTTHGGLDQLTGRLATAPFLTAIHSRLGVPVAVGIGAGHTARAAESNALTAVQESLEGDGQQAVYLDDAGTRFELAPSTGSSRRGGAGHAAPARTDARAMEIVSAVANARAAEPGHQVVADVETVAETMQVSHRTGRRMLKELVDAGLAWPLPPVRSTGGGRPRQQFRLLTEKLPSR